MAEAADKHEEMPAEPATEEAKPDANNCNDDGDNGTIMMMMTLLL